MDPVIKLFYSGSKALVTGGASFIGSTLVDQLVDLGANVVVLDDFSTGDLDHLSNSSQSIEVAEIDLRNSSSTSRMLKHYKPDVVFHLAAIHGGRGFIETFQKRILDNLIIDQNVYSSSLDTGVKMIVHASSACAYPVHLQSSESSRNLLKEPQANFTQPGGAFPDGTYGWVKLMGEYYLQTNVEKSKTKGRSARIFTAYGERENETHAAVALTAKAVLKCDPFEIWGSGNQTRNFTYVSDTVQGLLYLGADSRPIDFDVFNVGSSTHHTVNEFVNEILSQAGHKPDSIVFNSNLPTGVASRASDNTKIKETFGWEPTVEISTGINNLLNWYKGWPKRALSTEDLKGRLI